MDTPESQNLQNPQNLKSSLQVVTLLMVASAATIAVVPGLSAWLVYDRTAILNGQIWRMFTGHWVHFSTSHLVYDSLVLGIAGWIIEAKRLPDFGWLCMLAPWFISGVLLVAEPRMEWYGGLSALATAAVVYLALFGLEEAGLWRWACLVTLLGVAGKITFEAATGQMIFATVKNGAVVVSPVSHLSGVLIAVLFYVWARIPFSALSIRASTCERFTLGKPFKKSSIESPPFK